MKERDEVVGRRAPKAIDGGDKDTSRGSSSLPSEPNAQHDTKTRLLKEERRDSDETHNLPSCPLYFAIREQEISRGGSMERGKKGQIHTPLRERTRQRTIRVSYRAVSGARTSTGVGMSTLSQTPIAQGLGARLRRGPMAALCESAPCKHLSLSCFLPHHPLDLFFFLSPYGRDVFFFFFRCLLFDWIGAQARSTDRPQRPLSAGNLSCFGTSTDFIPDGSTSKLLSTLDSGTQIERRLPNSNSSFLSLWDGEDEKETLMTSSFSFA